MTKKQWTTIVQRTWLDAQLPAYLAARDSKLATNFFVDAWKQWKAKWPVDALTATELDNADSSKELAETLKDKAEELRFKTWFNNHTRPTTSGTGSRKILDLGTGPKLVQSWQAYENLYWETELKEKVAKEWEAYLAELPGGTNPVKKFAFRNQLLRQWYDALSEGEKTCVEDHRQMMKADGNTDEGDVNGAFQSAIDRVPRTLELAAEAIARQTGWNVSIIVGGPNPRMNGQITTIALHHGKTLDGKDFEAYLDKDYEEGVVGPFDDFLHASFSEEMRQTRVLRETTPGNAAEVLSDTPSKSVGQMKGLTEYEKQRAANIKSNNELLEQLGLLDASKTIGVQKKIPKKRKKKEKKEPTRRSKRRTTDLVETIETEAEAGVNTAKSAEQTNLESTSDSTQLQVQVAVGSQSIISHTEKIASDSLQPVSLPSTLVGISPCEANPAMPAPSKSPEPSSVSVLNLKNPSAVTHHAAPASVQLSSTLPSSDSLPATESDSHVMSHTTMETQAINQDLLAGKSREVVENSPECTGVDVAGLVSVKSGLHDAASCPESEGSTVDLFPTSWLTYLRANVQESRWLSLIARWSAYESLEPPVGRLSAKYRPEDVKWWIKRGKAMNSLPKIKNPGEYNALWWAWWNHMQPSWRGASLSRTIPADFEWTESDLLLGGSNGLALVVMTLGWWIKAIEPQD
ncbi:hypothetical protein M378DRAFT_17559 [Amanita muscaria Koide BX008]|uniref:Uncharacterized protein n=1 Tax=Amanita muscaria (strain Koide BX008) TaxID=946122 RepID=A0A0C2W425_AMAMK|nr:hypothetical protein M378DRAFT_17559 [Amanita muscaria Koide BX008]